MSITLEDLGKVLKKRKRGLFVEIYNWEEDEDEVMDYKLEEDIDTQVNKSYQKLFASMYSIKSQLRSKYFKVL